MHWLNILPRETLQSSVRFTAEGRNHDLFRTCRDPFGQSDAPMPLAFLYSTINGVARLIVDTRVEQGKIRTELARGKRSSRRSRTPI